MSGPISEYPRFLKGRHALVSWAYPDHIGVVADCCQSFCLDNGAFTVWKKGGVLDIKGYIKWVDLWRRHPGFDFAIIPDVVDGDEQANDELLRIWPLSKAHSAPVWHMHESLDRLTRLADNYRTVCLGSSGQWPTPGTEGWWNRMHQAMRAVCDTDGRPRCRLHGLRMLNPKIFTKLPLSSADSTNASVNAGSKSRFGIYVPPRPWQRAIIIADRIESYNSAPIWHGADQ